MTERAAFGADIKRARERRGLTLDAIADQTKVSATHFAGLERGDVSRWPSGIFRRAFVRSYALAVGLDPESTVAHFCRLFPDPADESAAGTPAVADSATTSAEEPGQRLALEAPAAPGSGALGPTWRRVLAGLLDVSLALTPAALVALAAGAQWFWIAAACAAMGGHVAFHALVGTTPGAWLLARLTAPVVVAGPARAERRRAEPDAAGSSRRRVTRQAHQRPTSHAHRVRH